MIKVCSRGVYFFGKNKKKELVKSVIDLTLALIKFIGAIALVVLAVKYLFS
ncbi:hypothetical protein [Paraclostridium sordellii]|uniref:hypothetical protein n=1 Tax=Paraclostridium sordellii TaxID=1505 RepID=UPI000A5FE307|nr:hypothetical protein [Paeniclostridium sordellii]